MLTSVRQFPRRFRGAPERSARIGRPLRLAARIRRPDQDLVDEIGRRMMTRDELGAALAEAFRLPSGDPYRVTMRSFQAALRSGRVPADAPPALRAFLASVCTDPTWLDRSLLERGARAYRRLGRSRGDVLLGLALIGGYRYGGPTELLVRTGNLNGAGTLRRLAETEAWTYAVSRPGGMRPGAEGWCATLHVRAMHALVAARYEARFDTAAHGLPVNQADLAATLGLFNSTTILGCRALGRYVSRAEADAIMHLWRYVGWLIGVDHDWLFGSERAQHRFNYHLLLAQGDVLPSGRVLAGAVVSATGADHDGSLPGRVRARWARRRLLGLLRVFLGRSGLRELGLPVVPPWPLPFALARNVAEVALVARCARGRRWLEASEERRCRARMARRFGADKPGPRSLPA